MLCVICSGPRPDAGVSPMYVSYMLCVMCSGASPMYVICLCYVFMTYVMLCICQGKPDNGVSLMTDAVGCQGEPDAGQESDVAFVPMQWARPKFCLCYVFMICIADMFICVSDYDLMLGLSRCS